MVGCISNRHTTTYTQWYADRAKKIQRIQTNIMWHASETNFVTGGAAPVCKAEKQGLKRTEWDRKLWHIEKIWSFSICHSKNCQSKIPSERNHTDLFQHANKQEWCMQSHVAHWLQNNKNGFTNTGLE